jgi:hypothetical protein
VLLGFGSAAIEQATSWQIDATSKLNSKLQLQHPKLDNPILHAAATQRLQSW